VMNKGKIVETGSIGDIIKRPKEDYTIRLIKAIPSIKDETRRHEVPVSPKPLVEVKNLTRDFDLSPGFFDRLIKGSKRNVVHAVRDVSFDIRKGSTYGLVGESGSGKSTCARMLDGLIKPTSGQELLQGDDMAGGLSPDRPETVPSIVQAHYG